MADVAPIDVVRDEVEGTHKLLHLAGHDFIAPTKLPPRFLVGVGRVQRGQVGGYEDALRSVLGDEQFEKYLDLPDADVNDDLEAITNAYGMGSGESQASRSPSGSTGTPSRPTSNGSTASTWGAPSGLPSLP